MEAAERCGYNRYGAPALRCASRLQSHPDLLPQFKGVDAYDADKLNEAPLNLNTENLPLRERISLSSDAQINEFDVSKETDFRDLVRVRPSPTAPRSP